MLAWLVNFASKYLKRKISVEKHNGLLVTIDSSRRTIVFLVITEGILLALMTIPALQPWSSGFEKTSISLIIAGFAHGLAKITGALLAWQLLKIKERATKPIDLAAAMFLKRILQLLIYAIGILFLLDYLGIPISPLIASLGIGGLAVALALQPTLANFFAGTQIVSDRVARIGDFIEIDDQVRGYVIDVGWRSTKIRTTTNNTIIIPNSVLSNGQVINYNLPNTALTISVYCGVSYESDLVHVKQVVTEVASEIIERMDEAVKKYEPWVGFDTFGESNIVFWVCIQAKDRLSSFNLKSELIIRLHERFQKENIVINYPVRMNYLKWPSNNHRHILRETKN